MNITITILRTHGTSETRDLGDWPEAPKYRQVREAVLPYLNGMDMERVRVFHEGAYTDMFVGEGSAINGEERNEAATEHYRRNWLTHNPGADPEALPAAYGPAVLFSRPVWF